MDRKLENIMIENDLKLKADETSMAAEKNKRFRSMVRDT